MEFRDKVLKQYNMKLFDRSRRCIKEGLLKMKRVGATRNELQIPVLLDAIEHHKFMFVSVEQDETKKSKSKRTLFSS